MSFDREAILAKARKVARINVENGATVQEAATAAALLARMLRKYQLSLADLDGDIASGLERDGCAIVRLFVKKGMQKANLNGRQMEIDGELAYSVSEGRGAWRWKYSAAGYILDAFDCRFAMVEHEKELWVGALGCASDAQCVGYYWDLFYRGLTPTANAYLKTRAIGAQDFGLVRNGFWSGAGEAVGSRVRCERSGNDGFTRQSQNRSLVLAKDAVIDRWCESAGYKKKRQSRLEIDSAAFVAGYEAGQDVPLNEGLTVQEGAV